MGGRTETGIRQARNANEASMVHPNSSHPNSTTNMTGWAPDQVATRRHDR